MDDNECLVKSKALYFILYRDLERANSLQSENFSLFTKTSSPLWKQPSRKVAKEKRIQFLIVPA